MDGIFLAYHNTAKIFGFQYLPLEAIDSYIFGPDDVSCTKDPTRLGWRVFSKCVGVLEAVADEVVNCFPGQVSPCLYSSHEDRSDLSRPSHVLQRHRIRMS